MHMTGAGDAGYFKDISMIAVIRNMGTNRILHYMKLLLLFAFWFRPGMILLLWSCCALRVFWKQLDCKYQLDTRNLYTFYWR